MPCAEDIAWDICGSSPNNEWANIAAIISGTCNMLRHPRFFLKYLVETFWNYQVVRSLISNLGRFTEIVWCFVALQPRTCHTILGCSKWLLSSFRSMNIYHIYVYNKHIVSSITIYTTAIHERTIVGASWPPRFDHDHWSLNRCLEIQVMVISMIELGCFP